MPDPQLPLNCLKCGSRLRYVSSEGETHIYHCDSHGFFRIRPDGRIDWLSAD